MERSLVILTFTIMHNYISSSKVDSFSTIIDKVRVLVPGMHYNNHVQANTTAPTLAPTPAGIALTNILQAPPVPTVTTVTIATSPSTSTLASNVGNSMNNNTAMTTSDVISTLFDMETNASEVE